MLRAVLDCNVLVAGLLSRAGPPAELLRRWLDGEFDLVASGMLLAELERVLGYPKIERRISSDHAQGFLRLLEDEARIAPDPPSVPESPESMPSDPDDEYLVRLAVTERAAIVSGDRHLSALAPDFPVHSPAEFVERLRRQPSEPGS